MANAQAEYRRQRGVDPRATTQQSIDAANAQLRSAQAGWPAPRRSWRWRSRSSCKSASRRPTSKPANASRSGQSAAGNRQPEPLLYRSPRPFDGFVTKRNVQPGTLVQAGTALFSLVSPNVWVVANFKESQLERMKPGDKVTVSVDARPDMELEGHIDSIQQGSGSRFSAFRRKTPPVTL